ncbi:hypothetical protein JCM10908_003087 [Rhodotorula pacifica]|uniref:PXA domain-containing protein n=1 Tax=Rhodotorula pacifica TaxID=1495444 RepID=UPI00316C6467
MAALRPKIPPRPSLRPATTPPALEKDTSPTPLHRRILFPPSASTPSPRILHSPSHELLDPLVLDLIALTLRAYVSPWYNGSISRDPDRQFLQAVTNVLVHVVQALEVRLAAFDWSAVILQDLPDLLTEHYRDWDLAEEKASTTNGPTSHSLSRDELFDRIHPHLAVRLIPPDTTPSTPSSASPPLGAQVDPTYLRALTDHLLKLLLPPEDYRSLTERAIVREILVGVVFRSVFERVAQPWFLHSLIAKQLEARNEVNRAARAKGEPLAQSSPAETIFAAVPSFVQRVVAIVGAWLASAASVSPPLATSAPSPLKAEDDDPPPPIHLSLLSLLSAVLPSSLFLTQFLSLLSLPLYFLSRPLSTYLSSTVRARIATARTAQLVLEAVKKALFPLEGGWPSPREPDPDAREREEWKARAERALAGALPDWLPTVVGVPTTTTPSGTLSSAPPKSTSAHVPITAQPRLALARHLLRPLASHTANVHLFVLVLDLVVGRLAPELVSGEGLGSD